MCLKYSFICSIYYRLGILLLFCFRADISIFQCISDPFYTYIYEVVYFLIGWYNSDYGFPGAKIWVRWVFISAFYFAVVRLNFSWGWGLFLVVMRSYFF